MADWHHQAANPPSMIVEGDGWRGHVPTTDLDPRRAVVVEEGGEVSVSDAPNQVYSLMRPDQFGRLEAIRAAFAEVTDSGGRLAALAKRQVVVGLDKRLKDLEGLMALKCLRIGMLGSSGAGKSTTVSNLLGVPENEGPTPPGGGGAGTGVATRIRAAEPGAPVRMRLEFMTKEQYSLRVHDLVSLIPGLGDADHGELLAMAKALPPDSPARSEEVHSLIALLEAHRAHGSKLDSVDDKVPFDRRAEVLMHPPAGSPPGVIPLLRQVVIDFPTDRIDPRLEMIDLPGLGVANRADEKLTTSFLPELNGAFVFIKASSANDEQVARLIEMMKRQFPKLGPRIWVIASGFDSLDANNMGEGPADRTVLSFLADFLNARGVGGDRILLIGNHLHQAWMYAKDRTPGAPKLDGPLIDEASRAMNLKLALPRDAAGRLVVPPKFSRNKDLAHAFEHTVLVDGGVGKLRETIKADVFNAVQAEVQKQVDDEMRDLIAGMTAELESARLRSHMLPVDLIRASHWRSELTVVNQESLHRDRSMYIPEATKLEVTLVNYIDSAVRSDLPIQDPSHPGVNMLDLVHRQHCKNLRDLGLDLAPGLVAQIFDRVDAKVNAIAVETLGTGPAALRNPNAAWSLRTSADRRDERWYRSAFESFQKPMVFVSDLDQAASTYPKEDYQAIMKHKSQAVTREFIRRVLSKLADHLKRLGDELLLIGDIDEPGDVATNELYVELIGKLKSSGVAFEGAMS